MTERKIIEGKLVRISGVETRVLGKKDYDGSSSHKTEIITNISIETKSGEENISFYGILFPDSLNHEVSYTQGEPKRLVGGAGTVSEVEQMLIDHDIKREYRGVYQKVGGRD